MLPPAGGNTFHRSWTTMLDPSSHSWGCCSGPSCSLPLSPLLMVLSLALGPADTELARCRSCSTRSRSALTSSASTGTCRETPQKALEPCASPPPLPVAWQSACPQNLHECPACRRFPHLHCIVHALGLSRHPSGAPGAAEAAAQEEERVAWDPNSGVGHLLQVPASRKVTGLPRIPHFQMH